MTASRCLCTVGAGLVPALCSRLLFWADTRDAPTDAVLLAVVLRGLKRGLRALRATKGAAGGGVLFALSGGHAGTAPTVLYSFGHPQGMPLRCCSLLGGHAGTAPTVLYSFGHPQGMPLRPYNNKRSPAGDLLLLQCNAVIR